MLGEQEQQQAFELLWSCWRDGRRLAALPSELRPASRREGYAIQARIEAQEEGAIAGWKLAATSRAGQAHIGVDGPLAGRLPASRILPSGATAPLGNSAMRVAEVEFVFRLGRDLAPRARVFGVEEVMDAVEALHLGIELPDSRFEDFVSAGAPQLLADAACANHFVLGPRAPDLWRSLDLAAHEVIGEVPGKCLRRGKGGNALGDPRIALAWLANELGDVGATLKAGQFVTTGTCVEPMAVEPGDEAIGRFGDLGEVRVRLA